MFQEYQEFFDVLWHTDDSGNKISIQRLNEQHKIVNNKIILMEIPDSFYKVTISNKYEININSEILSQNYFKVSYLTGEVYFHSSLEGQIITIAQYFGRGLIKTMAKRVELSNENNLYNASNVEDFATDITNRVNNIINNAGDSNIEIVDARDNSSTETVYTTLKDRLDSEYNNNIESLALKANQIDLNTTNSIVVLKADKTYVDTQITSVASGSPKGAYATLTDLQIALPTGNTNIYLVTADGKWYYWSGATWTPGGVYQSTGIADNSISVSKVDFVDGTNLFDGTFSTNWFSASTLLIAGEATTTFRSVIIPIEDGLQYTITIEGEHNRFRVGATNTLVIGEAVGVMPINQDGDAIYHKYVYTNSGNYNYLFVVVSNDSQEPSVIVTTNADLVIGNIAVAKNDEILLMGSNIRGTTSSVIFNTNGTIQKVQYKNSSNIILREDVYTYTTSLITEVRTLQNGKSITLTHDLITFETEVI